MDDIHSKISRVDPITPADAISVKGKSGKTGDSTFDKILAGQIKAGSQNQESGEPNSLSEIQGSFRARQMNTLSPAISEKTSRFTQQISDSLNLFERYAAFLGDPDKSLKQTYGLLEQILAQTRTLADQVSQEKEQRIPPDDKDHFQAIENMVTQLMTTARVEQIKFDRGDYL